MTYFWQAFQFKKISNNFNHFLNLYRARPILVIPAQKHWTLSNRSNRYNAILHFESPSQFFLRVASLRHVSGQHELLTHFKGITINKDFQCLKVILTLEMKTLKSMEPLLSESNFWNIWSTNVLDFVPVRTELYISIILSLLSCPSGLSWPS